MADVSWQTEEQAPALGDSNAPLGCSRGVGKLALQLFDDLRNLFGGLDGEAIDKDFSRISRVMASFLGLARWGKRRGGAVDANDGFVAQVQLVVRVHLGAEVV